MSASRVEFRIVEDPTSGSLPRYRIQRVYLNSSGEIEYVSDIPGELNGFTIGELHNRLVEISQAFEKPVLSRKENRGR